MCCSGLGLRACTARPPACKRRLRGAHCRRSLPSTSLRAWRVTVVTHYYGSVVYRHAPLVCRACNTSYCHNFVVPGPRISGPVRMELAGAIASCVCLQTGFDGIAFSLDFLRHFEGTLIHSGTSYMGHLRSYAAFWRNRALASKRAITLLTRAHQLFALLDFLALARYWAAYQAFGVCFCACGKPVRQAQPVLEQPPGRRDRCAATRGLWKSCIRVSLLACKTQFQLFAHSFLLLLIC